MLNRPESNGKGSLSKQFRCDDVEPYDRNSLTSKGDGDPLTADLSLLPTWNSKFADRLLKLKRKETNESFPVVINDVCNSVPTDNVADRASTLTRRACKKVKGLLNDEKENCESIERPADDRQNYLENLNDKQESHQTEACVSVKEHEVLSSIASCGDRYSEKQNHNEALSSEEENLVNQDEHRIENYKAFLSSIRSVVMNRLNEKSIKEKTKASQAVIPRIPAPILIEIIGSYVNDRNVWNSLSSLNRETYALSKNLKNFYRPWPNIRWRATTNTAKCGSPGQATFQELRPRRRVARGAVQMSARPRTVAFGTDYLCYGTDRGDVLLRKVQGDGSIRVLRGHHGCVNSVKCCGNWLISAGDDLETRIWNATTMCCEGILNGHNCSITSIAILPLENLDFDSASSMLVATAGLDGNIHIYSVHCYGNKLLSTKHLATCAEEFQPKPIYSIIMHEKDGHRHLLSGGFDSKLKLWDIDSVVVDAIKSSDGETKEQSSTNITVAHIRQNKCIYRYDGEIKSIAISRDKKKIAAAFGRTICYSNLSAKTLRHNNFVHHQGHNYRHRPRLERQRSLRNHGSALEGNSGNGFHTNDIEVNHWKVIRGHSGDIRCIDFSPDGKTVASACSDGSIRQWKLGERTWKQKWKAHNGFMVCSLAISPDGQSLLSAGSDGTIVTKGLF